MTHHYTVLHGGTILTLDGARPTDAASRAGGDPGVPDAAGRRATAICYAHDRILAVGGDAEVLALAGPDSHLVDLRGRAVLPGFVDPHAHPYWEGLVAGMRLLAGRERRAALQALPGGAERLEPDAWLVARYDPTGWDRPDDPTRDDLDRAVPDRPVLLAHVSGHAVTANSLALALAGIRMGTPDVPGRSAIERDGTGEPTGILRGPDAWDRVASAMPAPTAAEGHAALARAAARLAADGVTSVADADLGSTAGIAAELAAWGAAITSGAMPLAVALMPGLVRIAPAPDDAVPSPADIAAELPDAARDRVRLTHVKLKADGALTTHTAWLRAPYDDASHAGGPVHDPSALAERVRGAVAAGWAVGTHAIGDAARGRDPRRLCRRGGVRVRHRAPTRASPPGRARDAPRRRPHRAPGRDRVRRPSSSRSSSRGPGPRTGPASGRNARHGSSRSRRFSPPASRCRSPAIVPWSPARRSTACARPFAMTAASPSRRRSMHGRPRAPRRSVKRTPGAWRWGGAATS